MSFRSGNPAVLLWRSPDAAIVHSGHQWSAARAGEAAATPRNLIIVLVAVVLVATAVIIALLRRLRRLSASVRSLRAESGEVAAAFESVCDQAVSAVAEEARLRAIHSEVFAGMARRAQSLVRHQLRLIEQCERKGMPPAVSCRLGGLAARLRRTNENVLVLSGTGLVRERAEPVSLAEVFSAALSEIEQYQRVDVLDPPESAIAGAAAGDLTRILAELLDNATSFSPAEHAVIVQAQLLRDGSLSIALVDNGIGMPDEEVLGMNERLKNPGSLEPARSARVGLLVVGRLAEKNRFGVELLGGDASPGVTAVVSVPSALVLGARAVLPAGAGRR